jgi:hypothetical protein
MLHPFNNTYDGRSQIPIAIVCKVSASVVVHRKEGTVLCASGDEHETGKVQMAEEQMASHIENELARWPEILGLGVIGAFRFNVHSVRIVCTVGFFYASFPGLVH